MNKIVRISGIIGLVALVVVLTLPPQVIKVTNPSISVLSIHLLMELFAINISFSIVVISWYTLNDAKKDDSKVLICGFLVIAVCDLLHALTYAGMPAFFGESSTLRSMFYWLFGRMFEVITLGLIAFRLTPSFSRTSWLTVGILISILIAWLGSAQLSFFPITFIEGRGLTTFKSGCEYLISLLNFMISWQFWSRASRSQNNQYYLLSLSCLIMGLGEIIFTNYLRPSDFQNISGHLFKIVSYAVLYQATFVSSIRKPFELIKSSKRKLWESEERMTLISNNLPNIMIYQEIKESNGHFHYIYLSKTSKSIYGITPSEGTSNQSWLEEMILADDLPYFMNEKRNSADKLTNIDCNFRVLLHDASLKWIHMSSAPRETTNGDIIWDGVHTDITDRKRQEEQIISLGYYDSLTGLPNRRLFSDRLDQEIRKAQRDNECIELLFIDLDHFKEINDNLGHQMGDKLLIEAACRIKAIVRQQDTVARLGGDEYMVILPVNHNGLHSLSLVPQKIIDALESAFILDDQEYFISASIGIATYPVDAENTTDLIKQADQAMYAAKNEGRGCFRHFTKTMQEATEKRMQLSRDLRNAIKEDQLAVYYQPIIDLSNNKINKAEALLRWEHPKLGFISPAEFIPIAEENNSIDDLGDWVFIKVLNELKYWKVINPELQISVNKSPVQFISEDKTHNHWIELLESENLSGKDIVIEITEGVLLNTNQSVFDRLLKFRDAGIQVAIDDFGTGYSSLAYLKRFDIDYLKIDQSFTKNLHQNAPDFALCEAIIVMAHKLGLKVIAEGVETEQQLKLLKKIHCDYGQGYYFARPMPSYNFTTLLEAEMRSDTNVGAV